MATEKDIPTDLALEIGDDLEPSRFVASMRAFFGLMEELAQLPMQGEAPHWGVKVSKGSNIVALEFASYKNPTPFNDALKRISEGDRGTCFWGPRRHCLERKGGEFCQTSIRVDKKRWARGADANLGIPQPYRIRTPSGRIH